MRRLGVVLGLFVLAVPATAQRVIDKDGRVIQLFLHKDHPAVQAQPLARVNNLINHGGPTITVAQVVSIF